MWPKLLLSLDLASLLWAAMGMVICLRAGSNARFGPILSLAMPAGRFWVSAEYRWRVRAEASRIWGQVVDFSGDRGPIPWAAAVAFVSLPFFVLDLCHGDVADKAPRRHLIELNSLENKTL